MARVAAVTWFDPWPGNFHVLPRIQLKKKKKKKERERGSDCVTGKLEVKLVGLACVVLLWAWLGLHLLELLPYPGPA